MTTPGSDPTDGSPPQDLVGRARSGDRRALARAITDIENGSSRGPGLLAEFHRHAGGARRIGITGAPGVGKSTLTSELISIIRVQQLTVAVMALDPSSPFTGGSILGDRIRMQEHIGDTGVYIRSMASRGHLGGMSVAAPKVAMALDGAGFDFVLVETVGVGQGEVEIVGEADSTVVVVTPGWGDSVQANKAGLLEIGDVFVVNKADRPGAEEAVGDLEMMMDLGASRAWRPPVVVTVATESRGIDDLWQALGEHAEHMAGGELNERRERRLRATFDTAVRHEIVRHLASGTLPALETTMTSVLAGEIDPWAAAATIVEHL